MKMFGHKLDRLHKSFQKSPMRGNRMGKASQESDQTKTCGSILADWSLRNFRVCRSQR